MPYTNSVLFPNSPDPVVPSVAVHGMIDNDGIPGFSVIQAVNRGSVWMKSCRRWLERLRLGAAVHFPG